MEVEAKNDKVGENTIEFSSKKRAIDKYGYDTDTSDTDGSGKEERSERKKKRVEDVLPVGFLDPLSPQERAAMMREKEASSKEVAMEHNRDTFSMSCKQFWKAGDYEGDKHCASASYSGGMDHVRVHPKFLHSNATSHKWALGAFAELLDNALDESCNGATYVLVDVLENTKSTDKMLLFEDNGGGMTPEKMRHCMSLGYSSKSKMANTIGQYGNGFKTSTMRLGADVIVFSRCAGVGGRNATQSIGLLSYTFLRRTGKEDIMVPMVDYEKRGDDWNKLIRTSSEDWDRNLDTILQWSPYPTEKKLLQQFNSLEDQGTRIIIYNLWEDDEGRLELDFDVDQDDIQIREANRDEKKIEMAKNCPNSRHFLTYRHSLRSYASILYLRLPPGFRMLLRGKDIVHHNLVNDMMLAEEKIYKPMVTNQMPKDSNLVALLSIGFVKDAKFHIDIQGFNVYHKNRLIKPFWRVWNAAGSDGRGVIGVLEADFVEPAHDKQGFERTTVLARLEQKLKQLQKDYWLTNCHKIGYAPRRNKKYLSPGIGNATNGSNSNSNLNANYSDKGGSDAENPFDITPINSYGNSKFSNGLSNSGKRNENGIFAERSTQGNHPMTSKSKAVDTNGNKPTHSSIVKLEPGSVPRERSEKVDGVMVEHVMRKLQLEKDRSCSLQVKLEEAEKKLRAMDKEQETLIDVFSEERSRRDAEEENLRNRLQVASDTINDLLEKVKSLERKNTVTCKLER